MAATYPQWEYDLLTGLGAPATPNNLDALNYWGQSEGTASQNNPLAISGKHSGATKCLAQCGGTSPIYAYDSEADGVAATTKFLLGSNYGNVVNAFRKNQGLQAIWAAVNASGWCKGCQGGQYPSVLYKALGANKPPLSALATSGPTGGGEEAASGASSGSGCGAKGKIFGVATISFSYCQGKALVGGLLIGVGMGTALLGLLIIVAWGLGHTSAGRGAVAAARKVPLARAAVAAAV